MAHKRPSLRLTMIATTAIASSMLFAGSLQAQSSPGPKPLSSPGPKVTTPGIVIGEIRAFAFQDDKSLFTPTGLPTIPSLRSQGWIACEGQSLDNDQFPELAAVLKTSAGSTWGSADKNNVFNIPDLRGVFLRGYMHGSIPPNDPAGEPGDERNSPRPDMPQGVGNPGNTGAAVGSYQADAFGKHRHDTFLPQSPGPNRVDIFVPAGRSANGKQKSNEPTDDTGGTETRPKNVHVMYAIFTGRQVPSTVP